MSQTILCADDDHNLCQILARALREEGYQVETAYDGESALSKVQEISPSLLLLDVILPKRDGFSVLEAIREFETCETRMPVILHSGCTFTPSYEERAQALGVEAVLHKPVPLDHLLAQVSAGLGRQPVESANHAVDAAPIRLSRSAPFDLSGELEQVSFAALLHHLHGLRANGVLELQQGKKKKQIQLRDGRPVAVRSNLVHECLGNLLAASGTITLDVMHESLRRVKQGEGLQGQILMAMQMLDEEDLARALRVQAEEKLFEAFSWRKGQFRFHRGAQVRGANGLSLKRSTANILMDGIQLRCRQDQVDDFLADRSGRYPVPGQKPFYRFQEIELDSRGQQLLEGFDGNARIADLGDLSARDRRTLYGLLTLELLELRERAPSGQHRIQRPIRDSRTVRVDPAEDTMRSELAAMAERFRDLDYFGVLGVGRQASDDEIRSAYTELAKQTHPDRFSSASGTVTRLAEEVFGLVSRAYEVVGDRRRRLCYLADQDSRKRDAAELEEGHRALRAELEFQKGETALRGRRYEMAAGHFRAAVEAYPDEGEYRAYYGWALYLCAPDAPGRIPEALQHVLAGRKLAPDREKPYLFLGRLYKAAGRVKTAEKMFTRAIQLDPDCVDALRELRLIHLRREKSKGIVSKIFRR